MPEDWTNTAYWVVLNQTAFLLLLFPTDSYSAGCGGHRVPSNWCETCGLEPWRKTVRKYFCKTEQRVGVQSSCPQNRKREHELACALLSPEAKYFIQRLRCVLRPGETRIFRETALILCTSACKIQSLVSWTRNHWCWKLEMHRSWCKKESIKGRGVKSLSTILQSGLQ